MNPQPIEFVLNLINQTMMSMNIALALVFVLASCCHAWTFGARTVNSRNFATLKMAKELGKYKLLMLF